MATLLQKYEGLYGVQIMLKRLENGFELVKLLPEIFLTMSECDEIQKVPSHLELNMIEDARADMMDALEEYYKH